MGRLKFILFLVILNAACAQRAKHAEISAALPPHSEIKIDGLNLRTARASMKVRKKIVGLINFAQSDSNIKVEVQIEGLKSGPYIIHLVSVTSCKNLNPKKHAHKDLVEVIADKNGVVKTNIEFINMSTTELINKTIILQNKNKKPLEAATCGIIEKV